MAVLHEGFQTIHIPPSWQVLKLDEHPYYRQVCGKHNLKSMDYLLLDPQLGLYLVELKDYDSIALDQEDKDELATTLDQKAEDTKLLIRSIAHMYLRKRYYRWLWAIKPLHGFIPSRSRVWLLAADMINIGRCTTIYEIRHHG